MEFEVLNICARAARGSGGFSGGGNPDFERGVTSDHIPQENDPMGDIWGRENSLHRPHEDRVPPLYANPQILDNRVDRGMTTSSQPE